MGAGRPSKYDTHIKPYFEDIKRMCMYMTDRQIAERLGVAYSSFNLYKKNKAEFSELIKEGRQNLVFELKGNLIRASKGYTYSEKKIIKERDENGNMVVVREEISEKYMRPDVAATNLLLKNYDKENWANDPQELELKKKALELQKEKLESGTWEAVC